MAPFRKVMRDAKASMEQRLALLDQPCAWFRQFFGGHTPSLQEKALYVEQMVQRLVSMQIYENDTYHVEVNAYPPYLNLDIRRHDGGSYRTWRDFQEIKNQIVGPEYEAIELFPAESRLVDTSNQYHLWVYPHAGCRFPVGFMERLVIEPARYQRYGIATEEAGAGQVLPSDNAAA